MLEHVLIKAYMHKLCEILTVTCQIYQLLGSVVETAVQKKKAESFVILSSVSSYWWQTLVGWPQPDPESRDGRWVRHQILK